MFRIVTKLATCSFEHSAYFTDLLFMEWKVLSKYWMNCQTVAKCWSLWIEAGDDDKQFFFLKFHMKINRHSSSFFGKFLCWRIIIVERVQQPMAMDHDLHVKIKFMEIKFQEITLKNRKIFFLSFFNFPSELGSWTVFFGM